MTRYRKLAIQHKDGRIVKHKVRSDMVHEYGKIRVGRRVAYVHKSSEVRALEVVRGEGQGRRRVKLMASDTYEKRDGKDAKDTFGEVFLTVVLPEDEIESFKTYMAAEIERQSPWPVAIEFMEESSEATGVEPGVESAEVYKNLKKHDTMSTVVEGIAAAQIKDLGVKAAPAAPREEAQRILRAKFDDKVNRWRDPETGWFTLSPEAVR